MALSKDDILRILQQFLPQGLAWPRALSSVLSKLLRSAGALYEQLDLRLQELLLELNPATATELLTEWEDFTRVIDDCCVVPGTIEERRARVVLKLNEQGGPSIPYLLGLAEGLGYQDTTITEFRPATCEMACDGPVVTEIWRYVWQVNLPHEGDNHSFFRADSVCTDPVDAFSTGVLECRFSKIKPAHTYVIFTYEGLA